MPAAKETTDARDLPKQYRPADFEPRILDRWLASGAFHADPARVKSGEKRPYAILIPPPNVTAALHLGHALNNTLQDVLIRAKRMQGFEALWMPGTDHAGIATQTVVDKRLKAEGKPALAEHKKMELAGENGREKFVAEVQAFKDEYERRITEQLLKMGCSCDYDRQRFTMDPICARAVREAFFQLFKDGLIYRGKRLVNWDPVTQTALADDEVENEEVESSFWYLKYPVVDGSGDPTGEHVTVATTRPETYFGDTAVAVNPNDPQRARFIGRHVKLPFVGRTIPVVGDDYVVMPDPESSDSKAKYASGFLKVTPAHDPNDYEIGQRHDLPVINIMAPDASISDQHGWEDVGEATWAIGLSREDARAEVEKRFRDAGLLADKKPYTHAVGHSYRSHAIVEPYLSDQWYVRVTDDRMRGSALRAMAPHQRSGTSRDREGADTPPTSPTPPAQGIDFRNYLITFTTYGTWLHGDERGSVDRDHNIPGTPVVDADEERAAREEASLGGSPVTLNEAERRATRESIREVCEHRGWRLIAANVRTNHVHAVVSANTTPERVLNDFKSYATRRMREQNSERAATVREREHRTWTRHGSTRYLNDERSLDAAQRYVLEEQGEDLGGVFAADHSAGPLPHRRGSSEPGDGSLEFTPERYAKTFEFWHENLRDWCISRQLWWGHRIPVWTIDRYMEPIDGLATDDLQIPFPWRCQTREQAVTFKERFDQLANEGRIAVSFRGARNVEHTWGGTPSNPGQLDWGEANVVVRRDDDDEAIAFLEDYGFTQDPDVLDTWFSSALWPLSTMGWPNHEIQAPDARVLLPEDPGALRSIYVKRVNTWSEFVGKADEFSGDLIDRLIFLREKDADKLVYQLFSAADLSLPLYTPDEIQDCQDLVCAVGLKQHGEVMTEKFGAMHLDNWLLSHGFVNTADLLGAFNPTNVLCTAREIITLWVSRMVMFNRYFLAPSAGTSTLRVESGASETETGRDSERRGTPDLGHLPFRDVFIHAMIQDGEGRKMSKSLGNGVDPLDIIDSHGCDAMRFTLAKMTTQTQDVRMPVEHDPETGKNTSPKFDEGRNFCNKLWNAARFTLSILDRATDRSVAQASTPVTKDDLGLLDRWMLSRLAGTTASINANIDHYEYASYAQSLYDLLWRDFCDWYLEASKPTIDHSPAQQAVLRNALDTILRLLHPISPFITEAIHEQLCSRRATPIAGLTLDEPSKQNLLCTAGWPQVDPSLADPDAEDAFEKVRGLIDVVRQVRAQHQVKPKQRLTLHTDAPTLALVEQARDATLFLAGLEDITDVTPSADAVKFTHAGADHFLSGLAQGVDKDAETKRLTELLAKLDKDIQGLEGRLSNPGYTDKAPEHLVNQTRQQLADKVDERKRAAAALEALA